MTSDDLNLKLRYAVLEDMHKLFRWRNAEDTRRFFLDSSPLSLDEHERWLRDTLSRKDRHLLIAETGNEPVGVLQFDLNNESAEVSIYLVPGYAGKGIGTAILAAGTKWVREHLPATRKLLAQILPQNIASRKSFERAGFKEALRIYEVSID